MISTFVLMHVTGRRPCAMNHVKFIGAMLCVQLDRVYNKTVWSFITACFGYLPIW